MMNARAFSWGVKFQAILKTPLRWRTVPYMLKAGICSPFAAVAGKSSPSYVFLSVNALIAPIPTCSALIHASGKIIANTAPTSSACIRKGRPWLIMVRYSTFFRGLECRPGKSPENPNSLQPGWNPFTDSLAEACGLVVRLFRGRNEPVDSAFRVHFHDIPAGCIRAFLHSEAYE
jgi:hypothetical protein